MPLSEAQQDQNIPYIWKILLAVDAFYGEAYKAKLDDIFILLMRVLTEEDIVLSIEQGQKLLEDLICKTIVEKNPDVLTHVLKKWVVEYKKLEIIASETIRNKGNETLGIYEFLARGEKFRARTVFGSEKDLRLILTGIIKDPQDASADIEILTPIKLELGANVAEFEKTQRAGEELRIHIQTVIDKNPGKEMTLLIPVDCRGIHWRLAIININNNSVVKAKLWDSKAFFEHDITSTQSYKNMMSALELVNRGAKFKMSVEAARLQEDNYACMEYMIQKALKIKYRSSEEKKTLLRPLRKLRSAYFGDHLRDYSIQILLERPELVNVAAALARQVGMFDNKEKEKQRVPAVAMPASAPVKPPSGIKTFFKALAGGDGPVHTNPGFIPSSFM